MPQQLAGLRTLPPVSLPNAIGQGLHELDRREFPGGDRACGFGGAQPVQFGHGSVSHRPTPARIGGQGSAAGSVGRLIFSATLAACVAAAVTSSGNSASALARPARRASSSIVALSIDFSSAGARSARLVPSVHPLHAVEPNPYMRKAVTAGGDRRGSSPHDGDLRGRADPAAGLRPAYRRGHGPHRPAGDLPPSPG